MFIVIVTLGTTDLLFALDSIPAIYGLTNEAYLVLTANIFALMGLRQLYFLIGGLLKRLIYLSYGLAFLLAFIGVKLVLHAMHENELPFINGGEPIELGAGHPDLGLAAGDRRDPGRDHGGQPGGLEAARGRGRSAEEAAGGDRVPTRSAAERCVLDEPAGLRGVQHRALAGDEADVEDVAVRAGRRSTGRRAAPRRAAPAAAACHWSCASRGTTTPARR